tara:strand:+ start:1619 stop:2461 length:843 start_codon:yes stop_codon:yes gene_type:complete
MALTIQNILTVNSINLFSGGAVSTDFKMTVDTTQTGSASDTFVLPLHNGTTSMTVSWGDGNSDVITAWNQAELTHVYASSGTYQVSCDGSFAGLKQVAASDRLKIMSIDNWGVNVWTQCSFSFYQCTNMVANYTDNPTFTGNMNYMFYQCTNFNGALEIDATNCTTMYQMFLQCFNLNSPITFLNSSSVTNTWGMFYQCTVFDQDISSFDITSLTTATNMMISSAFSTTNYDLLLVAWDAFGTSSVPFHAGTAQYNTGAPATAHANMISRGWTITDGGLV